MLDYLIKVLLFQTLFLVVYDVVLKRETFFQWNRAYLVITSILAYIIPLIKLPQIANVVPQEYIVWLPEVMLSPQNVIKKQFDWYALLFIGLKWLFFIGIALAFLSFILRLLKLIQLIRINEKVKAAHYNLVYLNAPSAFSFFNYIFLGKQISDENKEQIIKHELVHVQQKHSIDLLFFELQKVVCWFNPYSFVYQNRICELHEFIADSIAVKSQDRSTYFQNLLAETFGTYKISFINPFLNHSLIKKRIVMLNKAKSKQLVKFKYLLMLPLLLVMLTYSSCENDDFDKKSNANKNEKRFVKLYFAGPNDAEYSEIISTKEGYFDMYLLAASPKDAQEISLNDLTEIEKKAFKNIKQRNIEAFGEGSKDYKFYLHNDGKKSIKEIINWKESIAHTKEKREYEIENDIHPFDAIDDAPIFPGCEDESNPKKCFNKKLADFVAQNFNVDLAKSQDLKPGKKKIYIQFKITKEGTVDIKGVRAPNRELEQEARRIINLLPKIKPGKVEGKPVNIMYVLPISFNIN